MGSDSAVADGALFRISSTAAGAGTGATAITVDHDSVDEVRGGHDERFDAHADAGYDVAGTVAGSDEGSHTRWRADSFFADDSSSSFRVYAAVATATTSFIDVAATGVRRCEHGTGVVRDRTSDHRQSDHGFFGPADAR